MIIGKDIKFKDIKFLVLYDGKLYQADLGSTVDIHGLTPVEITTHLTDEGVTYTIAKEENNNGEMGAIF